MGYAITYYGMEGQTGLYARVKRKEDGYWYDETADAWIAAATSACDLALTEGATVGIYTPTDASFDPKQGAKYITYVYTSADLLLSYTENTYQATQPKTALQLVQDIQRRLRLPISSDMTKTHDLLMLAFINSIIDKCFEAGQWDELDLSGGVNLEDGKKIYTIEPVNSISLDVINHMQISTSKPLQRFDSDADFRAYRRANISTESQPLYWRYYGRMGRGVMIEVAPTPNKVYLLDWEGQQKPSKLAATTDVCHLDPDMITEGALMMAKEEQGLDYKIEGDGFGYKLESRVKTESETNIGDVHAI